MKKFLTTTQQTLLALQKHRLLSKMQVYQHLRFTKLTDKTRLEPYLKLRQEYYNFNKTFRK